MKTIYLLLLVSLSTLANNTVKEKFAIGNTNPETKQTIMTDNPDPKNNAVIGGLKIVSCESQKYGKHIYITSDLYVEKKVDFYNAMGVKVYTIATVGSPIYLSELEKGTYKVKIIEGNKTSVKEFVVN